MTDRQTFRVDMPSLDAMSYIMCKSHAWLYLVGEKKTLLFASFVMQTSIMSLFFAGKKKFVITFQSFLSGSNILSMYII